MSGITQAELARRTKINPGTLHQILSGKREPRIGKLRKLSEVTGISIERLAQDIQ